MEGCFLPDLDVPPPVVLGPDAEDILAAAHAEHEATHLVRGLHELVANKSHKQLFPVAIGHALFQAHDPLATALVLVVLPHGTDALLEEVIVRHGR